MNKLSIKRKGRSGALPGSGRFADNVLPEIHGAKIGWTREMVYENGHFRGSTHLR